MIFSLSMSNVNNKNQKGWCPWRESDSRPLPYQGSALPLSHMGKNTTGAGEGNRTLVVSLENFCSTIELHPQAFPPNNNLNKRIPQRSPTQPTKSQNIIWWRGKDSNLRRQSRQIYSLIPLTAREPLLTEPVIMPITALYVKPNWHFLGLQATCR